MITGGYYSNPSSGYNEPRKSNTWLWILLAIAALAFLALIAR